MVQIKMSKIDLKKFFYEKYIEDMDIYMEKEKKR